MPPVKLLRKALNWPTSQMKYLAWRKQCNITSHEFVSENQVSSAESQFMRLCTECESINAEFQGVLSRITNRKRRPGTETDDKDRKKIIRFPLAGFLDSRKIEQMSERLEALRNQVMSAILFWLW